MALTSARAQPDHRQEDDDGDESPAIREIHALTPPPRRESWETSSLRSSSLSTVSSDVNFTSMSREFNALVLAGSTIVAGNEEAGVMNRNNLRSIDEDELVETNPLAIVLDTNPQQSPSRGSGRGRGGGDGVSELASSGALGVAGRDLSVQSVKKEEVLSKINAWQNAKIAKINNRFKREDAVINGWEGEQVQKATSWMKKVERKLDEKRAKAMEKMQNDIAKAHRKAEERRACAEAVRGTKVARILEVTNLMKAVGRPPVKRSFF